MARGLRIYRDIRYLTGRSRVMDLQFVGEFLTVDDLETTIFEKLTSRDLILNDLKSDIICKPEIGH